MSDLPMLMKTGGSGTTVQTHHSNPQPMLFKDTTTLPRDNVHSALKILIQCFTIYLHVYQHAVGIY